MFVLSMPGTCSLKKLALVAGMLFAASLSVAGEATDHERAVFRQAYASASTGGGDAWRPLAAGIETYPLYPYLQAAALEHDIKQTSLATVQSYIKHYPDWIPATDLRRDFLRELARRKDWNGFTVLYQRGLGEALACDALLASNAQGTLLDFNRDLASLWRKPRTPGTCDWVFNAAYTQGLLTSTRLWQRIDIAQEAGDAVSISKLIIWLPEGDRDAAQRLAQALTDPISALAAASSWPDTPRSREAALLAIVRLARRNVMSADTSWQGLKTHFTFDEAQRGDILRSLAVSYATDLDANAITRLADVPEAAQNDSTREWRVRVALAAQDWHAVLAGIAALSDAQQLNGEWRYFHALALAMLDRRKESGKVFAALAREPTYFGFLAADKINQPYAICPLHVFPDPDAERALLSRPGIARALELYAVGLPSFARREWSGALQGADQATQRLAAGVASHSGWYDRAVSALNGGDALRMYDLRFPLASEDGVVAQARQAGIEASWTYGILRQESAWVSDARSGADARGLMQLVPATGEMVARNNKLPWGGGDTLFDPKVNVQLGTRYLATLAARYQGSPWLASIAYNAGPGRVDRWLAARATLTPDVFIATIPFKETRDYVTQVMAFAVIYDWRLNGSVVSLATRMNSLGKDYSPPDAQSARRAVECPVAVTAND